jgi:hypothetical protein
MKPASNRVRTKSLFRPNLESLEAKLTPTAVTVSTLADSGAGSLRAAITNVNSGTADEIDFSVAGVIKLTSGALPSVTNTVKIDGTTAPGFGGTPVVEIDNNGFAGLDIQASPSMLRSLSIVNANGPGVTLQQEGHQSFQAPITVAGCYIGLALDGSIAPNTGVGLLDLSNDPDTIGGSTAADRNVISGNSGGGVQLGQMDAAQASNNQTIVEGNFIGTDSTGKAPAPNQGNGVILATSEGGATVGGLDPVSAAALGIPPGAGNVIAFNTQSGVVGPRGISNRILNNSIFSNGSKGIDLEGGINIDIPSAPQLTYAVELPASGVGTVQIGGVINSLSGLNYIVQVFATLQGVPAGQGQIYLGTVRTTPANRNGFVAFTFTGLAPTDAGTTFTATALAVNTSPFSNAVSIGTPMPTPNQAYVASVYELFFHRAPDAGSGFWVSQLDHGIAAAQVVLGIQGSPEYLGAQVAALYNLYLRRSPDQGGAQAWTNFLVSGGTLEQMAVGLVSSLEYYVVQGGTDQGYIIGLYSNVLNRGATTNDLVNWETVLNAGVPRVSVAAAFLTSQEYRANLVQAEYMTFLLRAADSGGLAAWVNALNAGATDQQVLAQIFGSAEGYQLWS